MSTCTLTRCQFDEACRAYIAARSNDTLSKLKHLPSDWAWVEHAHVSHLGYLTRTVHLRRRSARYPTLEGSEEYEEMEGDDDVAACSAPDDLLLRCTQYVVHSATFQVPTFYFALHDSTGSPLSLNQILDSTIFRPQTLPAGDAGTFAITLPESSLSLLSQGDHPTLGTPCWYFHPCHTAEVVGEIVGELDERRDDPSRWMEVWFMVMGNIVDFSVGC